MFCLLQIQPEGGGNLCTCLRATSGLWGGFGLCPTDGSKMNNCFYRAQFHQVTQSFILRGVVRSTGCPHPGSVCRETCANPFAFWCGVSRTPFASWAMEKYRGGFTDIPGFTFSWGPWALQDGVPFSSFALIWATQTVRHRGCKIKVHWKLSLKSWEYLWEAQEESGLDGDVHG